MKIKNEFFIEQIRSTQKLVDANDIPDETTIVYAVVIDDRLITTVYGDKDKVIDTCFTILEKVFNSHPSDLMPTMMQFIEHFISSHSSEKTEGDMS